MNPERTQDPGMPVTNPNGDPNTIQVAAAPSDPARVSAANTAVKATDAPAAGREYPPPPSPAMRAHEDEASGVGTEGEKTVWVARYSFKNFIGRIAMRVLVTIAWAIAVGFLDERFRDAGHRGWDWFVWVVWGAIALYWLVLGWRMMIARRSHKYELTTRRLFINTGFLARRRDQIELLRIDDVYVKQQGPIARLFHIGTVVIETSEERLPIHYIAGVDNPNRVMDLIWHHARKERDLRTTKVDEV
jgi:membrane protein YdbS with pleckstrin-like domain